jgi:hypothetical protein
MRKLFDAMYQHARDAGDKVAVSDSAEVTVIAVGRSIRPWKSASALRPPPCAGGSPEPSLGLTVFIEAQASISVPSTEK